MTRRVISARRDGDVTIHDDVWTSELGHDGGATMVKVLYERLTFSFLLLMYMGEGSCSYTIKI